MLRRVRVCESSLRAPAVRRNIDLVLTDRAMPGMPRQLAKHIRHDGRSCRCMPPLCRVPGELAASAALVKPYRQQDLQRW